ncbi:MULTISPECIES: 50S ribosomal protein L4 [unclassified Lentilitoribacter]|jgi:large subunit ribosomal protein L4|uniref:50S ribosomal protein L4 n=1 Tax=unclassified Lentilitoribacter TaxID=2647570 RepID=UPI0013A6A3F9|nr:50S ribosomal protein L4 [Lentilitoribacter sp. Alg239-R112]
MDISVNTLAGKESGKVTLSDSVFGLEPRQDLIQRVVRWQLAKKQQGTHKTLGRSEVNRTGARLYKQKGTGKARHHAASAPQFRGGGKAHGPVVRDHSHSMPKKVRALALKHALSAKAAANELIIMDELASKDPKTKGLTVALDKMGITHALFIGGAELDNNFKLAAQNIPNVDVLPVQGINVYDILRRGKLVLSKDAVAALEERLA